MLPVEPNHPGPAVAADPTAHETVLTASAPTVLMLVALGVRLAYLWSITGRPELFSPAPGLVEDLYLALARRVAAGDLLLGDQVYWYSPLYAYLTGGLTALCGDSPWGIRGANLCLGTGTVGLLYLGVLRTFHSRPVALAAGWGAALYGPLIVYDTSAMPTTSGLFLLALTLWLVQRARQRDSIGAWLLVGVALGGALNLNDRLGLFAVLLVAWLLVVGPSMADQARLGLKRRAARAALLTIGLALAILPFTLRNLLVAGEPVLISANSDVERYIGNHANAWGGMLTIPGVRPNPAGYWSDARRVAERALGHAASSTEVSSYWTARALEHIRADPGHFLSLLQTRLLLSVNAYEIAQSYSWRYQASRSKLLATLPDAGLLLALGLAGAVLALGRVRDSAPWLLLAVSVLTGLVLTVVNWRDRMPLILALLPFAALYLIAMRDWLRGRRWSRLIPALLLLSATAVLVHLPQVDAGIQRREIAVADHNNRSSTRLRQLMERLEAPGLSASQRRSIYLRVARLRRSRLDYEGAVRVLKEAVARFPHDRRLWRALQRLARMTDEQLILVAARRAIQELGAVSAHDRLRNGRERRPLPRLRGTGEPSIKSVTQ